MNTPLRVETLAGPVERSQGPAGAMVRLIMTLLLFFTFLSSGAAAQPSANTEDLVLRTGDVLFIGLPGEDTLNAEFRIDRRGMIWIPEVGSLKVSGLSLERAQAEVKQALSRYFRDLDGYEFQLRERRLLIQVQGHVANPGTYELAEDVDLQGAITAAGGLRTGAQLDRMHIRRGDQILPFDFKAYLDSGDISKLPRLQTLDALFVPISPLTGNVEVDFDANSLLSQGDSSDMAGGISVFGQVHRPGSFAFAAEDTLIHYLMRAGGVNNYADVKTIRVVGSSGPQIFNLTQFLDSGDAGNLPKLVPGSTIFVPLLSDDTDKTEAGTGVKVFGQVQAPGRYPFRDGDKLLDYLIQAGGVNNYADVDKIRIITDANPVLFSLTEYLDSGNAELLPAIGSGTTIFVPIKTESVQSGKRVIYVMGEVFSPGAYEVQEGTGFLDVLANAGGPTRFAESRQIRVLKGDGSVLSFDLNAYSEGTTTAPMPQVRAGDAIFVPEKSDQVSGSWLKTPPKRAIKILGAVNSPGRYEWSDEMALIDLIGHAGGPTPKADTSKLRIIPGGADAGQPPLVFNFEQFVKEGESYTQPRLRAGYTVIMPELPSSPIDNKSLWVRQPSETSIYVMGAVGVPGRYAFNMQLNLLDILAAANGPTVEADLNRIQIRDRNNESSRRFDLTAYLRNDADEQLPVVQPEDVIFVPFQSSPSQPITVLGAVNNPGQYEFSEGLSLIQLLGLAGGPDEDADLAYIRIKSQAIGGSRRFDMVKWLDDDGAGFEQLPRLTIGDSVIVPRQPDSPIDNKQRWLQLSSDQTIYILGEVGLPGRYAFNPQMNFLDILAAANGPTADADLENIRITYRRPGRRWTESFNLPAYMEAGDESALPPVRNGDVILLTSEENSLDSINIIGAVGAPGRIDYSQGMNLVDALTLASGPTSTADSAHILIVRRGATPKPAVEFDLGSFGARGGSALPPIGPGDTIIVPELPDDPNDNKSRWVQQAPENSIYIMGAVGRPGRYAFNDSQGFLDILAAADGPTADADYENILITYRRPNRSWTGRFSLAAYMQSGDESLLPRVLPGDLILVPTEEDSDQTINVIGDVNNPGRVDYKLGMNLIDVLALAGGHTRRADVAHIQVIPDNANQRLACMREQRCAEFDLRDFEQYGNSALPDVGPGFTIIVPTLPDDPTDDKSRWAQQASEDSIYIMGAVVSPGRYAFNDRLHFLDLLAAAEGPSSSADLHNIRVSHRNGTTALVSELNLALYFETGDEHLLPDIRPQDVIFVPHRDRQWLDISKDKTVRVLGAVRAPGRYEFSSEMTILDLLAEAGGTSSDADVHNLLIVTRSVNGAVSHRFDLRHFAGSGEFGELPVLRPGDTIYVPNRDDSAWTRFFDNVRDILSILSVVAIIAAL